MYISGFKNSYKTVAAVGLTRVNRENYNANCDCAKKVALLPGRLIWLQSCAWQHALSGFEKADGIIRRGSLSMCFANKES